MTRAILLATIFALSTVAADAAPEWPLTRPERTHGLETSSYIDTLTFLDVLRTLGAPIVVKPIGRSPQGHDIPLVTVADPPVSSAEGARATGRVVVYLQANIHGGEVEGKEAVQMLVREIAQGHHPKWLKHLVIIATPIYNIDGNENLGDGLKNRSHQNGPGRVGTRANGSGLDLNRDAMKAGSPEMRASLDHVFRRWDPHLTIDLHTTNGTRHGFALTYSPPLHPDTDPGLLAFTRDELLPGACRLLAPRHGLQTFDYGNAVQRSGRRIWLTFSPAPRYVTNYVGLRNRVAILAEATSYLPFPDRIRATRLFVTAILDLVAERPAHLADLTRAADKRAAKRGSRQDSKAVIGIRFEPASRGEENVPLERRDGPVQRKPHEAPGELESALLPIHDRFRTTRSAPLPVAYVLPRNEAGVVDLLKRHGIDVRTLSFPATGVGWKLRLATVEVRAKPVEGHRTVSLTGDYEETQIHLPARTFLVQTAQPLGLLAAHLLDPESLDGVTAWGLLDTPLVSGNHHPTIKLHSPLEPVLAPED